LGLKVPEHTGEELIHHLNLYDMLKDMRENTEAKHLDFDPFEKK
jgi:hypothetical protein